MQKLVLPLGAALLLVGCASHSALLQTDTMGGAPGVTYATTAMISYSSKNGWQVSLTEAPR